MISHELDVAANFARTLLCLSRPEHVLTPDTLKHLCGKKASVYRHHQRAG